MEAMKKEIFSPLKKVSNNKYLQQANSSNEHFLEGLSSSQSESEMESEWSLKA